MTLSFILQQLISGVAIGMTYALMAIGYSMVYGILKFINFGHAGIYMIGTYTAFFSWIFILNYLPLWPSFILSLTFAMLVAALFGVVVEKICYKPIRGKSRLTTFMSALGVAMLVTYGMEFLVGPQPRTTPMLFEDVRFHVAGAIVTGMQIFMLVITIVAMLILQWFIKNTRTGRAIRACSLDAGAASLMGVNLSTTISWTFAIGSSLGALSGTLVAIYYTTIYPTMGWMAGLKGFVAAVTGGIGSVPGALTGLDLGNGRKPRRRFPDLKL